MAIATAGPANSDVILMRLLLWFVPGAIHLQRVTSHPSVASTGKNASHEAGVVTIPVKKFRLVWFCAVCSNAT